MPTPDPRPHLTESQPAHLGAMLQELYRDLVTEPLPVRLQELVGRFVAAREGQTLPAAAFRDELLAMMKPLRAYAMSLTRSGSRADDLVQETLLRAWENQDRFAPGTNLPAWLFTIMRNCFLSQKRKSYQECEDVDDTAAAQLTLPPDQAAAVELKQVWSRLSDLPAPQRETLLLVAVHGLSLKEAAEILKCQVGTVKSRVCRARAMLAGKLEQADEPPLRRAVQRHTT